MVFEINAGSLLLIVVGAGFVIAAVFASVALAVFLMVLAAVMFVQAYRMRNRHRG